MGPRERAGRHYKARDRRIQIGGRVAVAAAAVVGVAAVVLLVDHSEETQFAIDNLSSDIGGQPTTCDQLWGSECEFDTQFAFNKWGSRLDTVASRDDLGDFANNVGSTERARLVLSTCVVSLLSDNTVEDLVEAEQGNHPGLIPAQVYTIWQLTRSDVCRPVM